MTSFTTTSASQCDYALVSAEAILARSQVVLAGLPPVDTEPTIIRRIELRQRPFTAVQQKLRLFADLQPDWDSYEALAISETAIVTAQALLGDLSLRPSAFGSRSLVPFSIAPVATGGINIEWRREDAAALELWIGPDGAVTSLLDHRGSEPRFKEVLLSGIPAAVTEVLAFAG